MAKFRSFSIPVWIALVLAAVGIVGAWRWVEGRGERASATAAADAPGSAGRLLPTRPPPADGPPPPPNGPGLGSTQKQFAEVQKGIPEPETIPVALTVEGREGVVRSPFAPDSGYIDVGGLPSGSKARCPYTGKTFLVP